MRLKPIPKTLREVYGSVDVSADSAAAVCSSNPSSDSYFQLCTPTFSLRHEFFKCFRKYITWFIIKCIIIDVIFHSPKINSFLAPNPILPQISFSNHKFQFYPKINSLISSFSLISCLFRFLLLKISNLQASNVADGINVTLPRALDGALNAIIPSELPFLDVEAIVAEIVFSKLSASFRVSLTYTFNLTRISFFCPMY